MTTKTTIGALFLITLSSLSHAQEVSKNSPTPSFLEKKGGLSGRIKKEFAQLEIDQDLDLDFDVIDGLNGLLGYTYEVEPAFLGKNFYTRVDKYRVKVGIDAGDLLEGISPIFLNVDKGAEIVFARIIKDQKTALTTMPISPTKVPFRAEKFDQLEVGTFVSIPTSLNILTGIQDSWALRGDLPLSAGIYHLISGEFNIHILKLPENKARVRIFSRRMKNTSIKAGIKHTMELFEISLANKVVNKIIKKDIAQVYAGINNGDIVLFDYVLDMSKPEVRHAYESVLHSTFGFKRLKISNPFMDEKKIEQALVADLTELEALAHADKGQGERRVERLIKGLDKYQSKNIGFDIRLNLMNWAGKNEFIKHHFQFNKGDEEQRKHLIMMNRNERREKSMLFGYGKEDSSVNYYALGLADAKGRPLADGVTDVGFSFEFKDKIMDPLEQKEVQTRITKQLPKAVSDLIDWNKIITADKQRNTRVFFNVVFNRKAKNIMRKMGPAKVNAELKVFRDYLWKRKGYVFAGGDRDLIDFQNKLSSVLENGLTGSVREEKMSEFVKLTRDDTFEQIGLGSLLHLLSSSGERLDQLAKVDMIWTSRGKESYHFTFGFSDKREEYESLEFIREVILRGNTYDFRLLGYQP